MVNNVFVLHKEVIDVFVKSSTSPQKKKCHFFLPMLVFSVHWTLGRLEMIFHDNASTNIYKLKKVFAEKFSKTTGIEIQSQSCGRNR